MIYLKKFNENEDSSIFDCDNYIDYLCSVIEESKMKVQVKSKFSLYIEAYISVGESDSVKRYLQNNDRFIDVIVKSDYDYDYDCFFILIVDRFFYSRNQKLYISNIKWDDHPLFLQLKKTSTGLSTDFLLKRASEYKMVMDLPENLSLIKGVNYVGSIEFWPKDDFEDPINLSETSKGDMIYFQFLLFKYLGS